MITGVNKNIINKNKLYRSLFQSGNNEGKSFYIHQVQGESAFELGIDSSCHYNCSSEPLKTNLKAGEVGKFIWVGGRHSPCSAGEWSDSQF